VTQEQLHSPEISSAPVNQRRLGSAHGMRGVLEWVEADAADPLADQASVLTCRQILVGTATAGEQALTERSVGDSKVVVQCLSSHFGKLEANGPTGLALPDVGAVDRVAVERRRRS
jgi:hypothetical protein